MQRITPFLWFAEEAEEAARFYVSVFPNAEIREIVRYGKVGPRPAGSVFTVAFVLDRQRFTALNGGPDAPFTEALSFVVDCTTQGEVDHYWDRLGAGGQPSRCGWLKDRFGVSWQIVPHALVDYLRDPDTDRSSRVMAAMMTMTRIDIARLDQAYRG